MRLRFAAFEALLGAVCGSSTLTTMYFDQHLVSASASTMLASRRLKCMHRFLVDDAFSLQHLSLSFNCLGDKDISVCGCCCAPPNLTATSL